MRRSLACLVLVSSLLATEVRASDILGPPTDDGPVVVDIGFFLSQITHIDEEEETIEFEGILTLRWKDPRQAFDPAELGYDEKFYQGNYQFSEVFEGWWPQVVLSNEAGRYDRQGVMLRVSPNGDMTYIEEIDAVAEARMNLRRLPFDEQHLYAMFEVLGFDTSAVVLRSDPTKTGRWETNSHWIHVPQWYPPDIGTGTDEYYPVFGGATTAPTSVFVFKIEVTRDPGYLIRLVLFPLTTLVILSWSVFWMSRSSLGERMDVSFIGILSIVAYQITISGLMPKISYATVLSTYLMISFVMMSASVVVNLAIGRVDQKGHYELGDLIDLHCRWVFPLTYVILITSICGWMYWRG